MKNIKRVFGFFLVATVLTFGAVPVSSGPYSGPCYYKNKRLYAGPKGGC